MVPLPFMHLRAHGTRLARDCLGSSRPCHTSKAIEVEFRRLRALNKLVEVGHRVAAFLVDDAGVFRAVDVVGCRAAKRRVCAQRCVVQMIAAQIDRANELFLNVGRQRVEELLSTGLAGGDNILEILNRVIDRHRRNLRLVGRYSGRYHRGRTRHYGCPARCYRDSLAAENPPTCLFLYFNPHPVGGSCR